MDGCVCSLYFDLFGTCVDNFSLTCLLFFFVLFGKCGDNFSLTFLLIHVALYHFNSFCQT